MLYITCGDVNFVDFIIFHISPNAVFFFGFHLAKLQSNLLNQVFGPSCTRKIELDVRKPELMFLR